MIWPQLAGRGTIYYRARYSLGDDLAFFVEDADFDGPLATTLDLTTDSGHEHGPGGVA